MKELIQIFCKNNNISKSFPIGSSLLEIYEGFNLNLPHTIMCAKVNNVTEGLKYKVFNYKDVEFLDLTSPSAMRAYVRSLCFVLYKAIKEVFPEGKLCVEHPVSKGYFCNIDIGKPLTDEDVAAIKDRMGDIIGQDLSFHRIECRSEDAIEVFRSQDLMDKVKLLQSTGSLYTYYYKLGDLVDYYYGCLVPSTSYLTIFDLMPYHDGVLLRIPSKTNPRVLDSYVKQNKMFDVFKEHVEWSRIMGVRNVGDINVTSEEGNATSLINVAEALQEKRIGQIADDIYNRGRNGDRIRLILISGPSSSGKTTFSKRLSIQLMTNGIKPMPISLDNYFVEREDTPKDEKGEYDFESLYALDLDLFNSHIKALLGGEEIEIPRFNFTTGKKEYRGDFLKLEEDMLVVLEGIHALNPELTAYIPDQYKYKVYVSALTTISIDDHNWIPTTDNRLIRRIIRDFYYRGYSPRNTISRWNSIRKGEDKWIFPFQENADAMFNSALLFELAALRLHIEPILMTVPQNSNEYSEAYRLLRFIQLFTPIQDKEIPPTSLLREFMGGSSFTY